MTQKSKNPYNPAIPGNLFIGYERLRGNILNGFLNGNSFAILGGRRCGKTSLLMQIEKDLGNKRLLPYHPIPARFSLQELGSLTPDILFEKIYNLVIQGIQAAPDWGDSQPDREGQKFLKALDTISPMLNKHYGPDWLIVLLIDELDSAISHLPDDQFFQNIRNLLMESRFHRHFRLVATGVKEMARLISSGSSPLNNLRNQYLGILTSRQAQKLVEIEFNYKDDSETLHFLFELTGKHPFLLDILNGIFPV